MSFFLESSTIKILHFLNISFYYLIYSDIINEEKYFMKMLNVDRSDKENWKMSGIDSAGFWSRWYLWSYPTFGEVEKFMSKRFNIKITRR